MGPKSPTEIIEASSQPLPVPSPTSSDQKALAKFSPEAIQALTDRGFTMADFVRREAPFHWKVGWEELCTLDTQDPKTKVSPVLAVTSVVSMPEAEQMYDDYHGIIRVEFFTESGQPLAVTHAYAYAATGELTPLSAWMTATPPPFLARIAYVETNKPGRHVVRPVPTEIEIL